MPPAFTDHVALLAAYLDRRGQVVEALEDLFESRTRLDDKAAHAHTW